jgi:DUF1680 family protein
VKSRGACVIDVSGSAHAALRPVPISAVTLDGGLWGERARVNAEVTLPSQRRLLEERGTLDNFRRAAGGAAAAGLAFRGLEFADTDLYKWIEAASWVLAQRPDEELRRGIEEGVALIEAAQCPDGYLDTHHAGAQRSERWTDLRSHHELYCAGHLLQAAVANHRATGDERLLHVAERCADLLCSVFGPEGSGRRPGIDGHPGVELALVELFRETRERRYLEQARYFFEARGHGLLGDSRLGPAYYQDELPLRATDRLAGHAVRALYHVVGATDLYLETGDEGLLQVLTRLWSRMVTRQLYVSGGLGARSDTESFGEDLELPSARACSETCAAIGSVMWCHRLLAATGEARYADLLEWTLLNAVLPGWSLDGRGYFYTNPLEDGGGHRRQPWYECACCPPNLARTVAALPGYVYSTSREDAVFVHLYAEGTARLALADGRAVGLSQHTRYPWDGEVDLEVQAEGELALHLRIPGWCEPGAASLVVNGVGLELPLVPGSYAALRRSWRAGDRVRLQLPMPVRFQRCHPAVLENAGRVAITRGPLLYCLEGVDHPAVDLRHVEVAPRRGLSQRWEPGLLGGVVALRGPGSLVQPDDGWEEKLYRPTGTVGGSRRRELPILAVPYFAWANRAPGPMQVWLRAGEG